MFIAFNNNQMDRETEVVARPSTIELSHAFMETDTEIDEDEEVEAAITITEQMASEPMETDELEPAAAASSAPVKRTRSVIDGDNQKFVEEFLEMYQITEWKSINELQLDSAALESNPGGHSTKGLEEKCIALLAAKRRHALSRSA
jgi:hypothetical protein